MKKFLKDVLKISRKRLVNHPEFPLNGFLHFSAIVYGGKIISIGVNHRGNPPEKFGYPDRAKYHSEIDAFEKAKGLLCGDSFILVNIRMNKEGELRNSFPCENCYRLMKKFNCKKIYYSTEENLFRRVL